MAKQQVNTRVRIIGAGLGGLTLGRTLLKHSIPAVLYERRPSARRHGFGVTLHEPAYRMLLDLLGLGEEEFRQRVAVNARFRGTGKIDPALLVRPEPGVDYATSFRAHRHRLEKLLGGPLDIRYGEEVEMVSPGTAPGLVALHMKGSAAPNLKGLNEHYQLQGIPFRVPIPFALQTPCLVGADGGASAVRRSLAHDTPVKILPYVMYNGWRRITQSQFERFYAPAMQGSTVIETKLGDNVVLNISVNDTHTGVVDMGFVYSRPAKGNKWSLDPLHMAGREENETKQVPEEFYKEIAALEGLEEPFKHMFDATKVKEDGHSMHWLVRTALVSPEHLQELAGNGAFLLGDAAHTHNVLGEEGAGSVIMDGVGLGNCIAEHGPSGIPDWYDSRYEEWESGIRKGEEAIREMHGGS